MPKLSIVIPVYNEAGTIRDVVARVQASVKKQNLDAELICVNDGSKDGSLSILRGIGGITVHDKPNGGKGSAVKLGFEKAKGDIFIIQDADLEYDPDDYSAVIAPIVKGECEVTMGSRFLKERPVFFFGEKKSPYFTHYMGNRLIIWLTNLLYWNDATDYEGCYKAFTSKVIRSIAIKSDGFEYDNELICKILKRGHRVVEVPISYNPRSYESGKKITWRHGVKMLWTILKYRFID